jgi:hypothetical protein
MEGAMTEPNWGLEIAKIAVPVFLGALVWAVQNLAQRAWSEYEQRRDVYLEVIQFIDALFQGGLVADRLLYLRSIRKAWLVGSDDVVLAANRLTAAIREHASPAQTEEAYRDFIAQMRIDMRQRRWLPPKGTSLGRGNFPIEGVA